MKTRIFRTLSNTIYKGLRAASNPSQTNAFVTQEDLLSVGIGTNIFVVDDYNALPDPTQHSGEFYWTENSVGTPWLPGNLGGSYRKRGLYYSNGTEWKSTQSPYQATQGEVDAGVNNTKFVTPLTLGNSALWGQAEDFADDAEKHAQQTGSFTDSNGDRFDNGAKGYAGEAKAEADSIKDKFDFTDAEEGDLYQVDALGVAQPVTVADILQDKDNLKISPLASHIDLRNLIMYDSFNRPDENLGASQSDSGHDWISWNNTMTIENEVLVGNSDAIVVMERSFFGLATNSNLNRRRGSVLVTSHAASRGGITPCGIVIGRNSSNYLYFSIDNAKILAVKVIAGVQTAVSSLSVTVNFSSQKQTFEKFNVILEHDVFGDLSFYCWADNPRYRLLSTDISSDFADLFPTAEDVKYIGLISANNTTQFSTIQAFNLTQ